MKVLVGKKLGMTRVFSETGRATGVTAVEILPAKVLRVKTVEKDGYEAMQIGAGKRRNVGKAVLGQTGGEPYAVIAEFEKISDDVAPGAELSIDQFEEGEAVLVTATSKGKGFQGTIKRHNFHRGPMSHGSHNKRRPGSIGGVDAARVFPGQKMPGRMGAERVTQKNIKVIAIHKDENVLLLGGSVPGPVGSKVIVRSS